MDMMQTGGYQNQSQDGSASRSNFWPQYVMGQGGMPPSGQVPPMPGVQPTLFSSSTTPALARFPSGSARPSMPAPLLMPVPAQQLHHTQSGGSLLKQLPPGAKPATSENLSAKVRKPYTITKQRERWTEAEHDRFLEALKLHGRAWRKIEEHIGSKTAVQIRSHAQKFFSKLEREGSTANPASSAPEIDIPPPRPKRKPSHPYPRKAGGNMSESESEYGPSPRVGSRLEIPDEAISPNMDPMEIERSRSLSLWRNNSTPDLPMASPGSHLRDPSALPLPLSRAVSAGPALPGSVDHLNSLKLFGQLLGPKHAEKEPEARHQHHRVVNKLLPEDACERHATSERSFLESGVSSAVIEGDATEPYAPSTSGRGSLAPSGSISKDLARQQSCSLRTTDSKDGPFVHPPPKATMPSARPFQTPPTHTPSPTISQADLAYSQAPVGPPMSGPMPAQLVQMMANQFRAGPGQFGGNPQQWLPFANGGSWSSAAFEQLAMMAQINAYNSAGSNPFGPWGMNPMAMWGGFGPGAAGSGGGVPGPEGQSVEEAAAEGRAAAAAVAAATMAAASAWWSLQNNAAAAAQMGCPPPMHFPMPPYQQQQQQHQHQRQQQQQQQHQQQQPVVSSASQAPSLGGSYGAPPLQRMPTARSMPRAARSEETPARNGSPPASAKESDLEQRGSAARVPVPSASAPQLDAEPASSDPRSMGAPGGIPREAAIRRAERANKLRELKGRGGKVGELAADSSVTPGVFSDSSPYTVSQNRRSLESSADKESVAVVKGGDRTEVVEDVRAMRLKGGDQPQDARALEMAILKKLKKDERRRDKLRTQSGSGSNEPALGGGGAVPGHSNDRTVEPAPQRGGSPPEVSNSDGRASGSGKEGSGGGPSSNSSAIGDNPELIQQDVRGREGSEGASTEAEERAANKGGVSKDGGEKGAEKGGQVMDAMGSKQGRAFNDLFRQQPLPQSFSPLGEHGSADSNPTVKAAAAAAGGPKQASKGEGLGHTWSGKHHHHRHHTTAAQHVSATTLGSSTAGGSCGFVPYKGYQGSLVNIVREGSLDPQGRGREIKHDRAEGKELPSPAKRQRVQVVAGEGMSKDGPEEWRSRSPLEKSGAPQEGGAEDLATPMQS